MGRRVLTTIVLFVVGMPALLLGGMPYFLFMSVFLLGAAWEYTQMFRAVGQRPSTIITVGGVLAISLARLFFPDALVTVLSALVLIAMAYHLVMYEKGRDLAAQDFAVTIAGLAYLGWVGSYLLELRNLPNGGWWLFLALGCVWLADTGAYTIGAAYGKHKMTPRLSPKKSWEGFAAGVFTAVIGGAFLAFCFVQWGPLDGQITPWQGALMGLLMGTLTPLGDLGESMLKRQAHMKDSSHVFPGHGGFFDRIDSWLWGAVIGYYFITWFLI